MFGLCAASAQCGERMASSGPARASAKPRSRYLKNSCKLEIGAIDLVLAKPLFATKGPARSRDKLWQHACIAIDGPVRTARSTQILLPPSGKPIQLPLRLLWKYRSAIYELPSAASAAELETGQSRIRLLMDVQTPLLAPPPVVRTLLTRSAPSSASVR